MRIIITGCGRVGSQLALFLAYEGHDVVIIDHDDKSFARLGGTFNGVTLTGAAFDEDLLLEAGIETADALAAVTNYDNTNLMVAEIARRVFGVPAVAARLFNPEKRYIFDRLGVRFVNGTALIAESIMARLLQREIAIHQERLDVGIRVVEFAVSPQVGKVAAGDLEDGVSTRILCLTRDGKQLRWDRDTALEAGDRVVVAARPDAWRDMDAWWVGAASSNRRAGAASPRSPRRRNMARIKVVIAGCGRVGAGMAEMLSLDGHEVTVIDRDASAFRRLFKMFPGRAVEGMAFDVDTLREAGIEEADAFAAVTSFDNANLMSAEVARELFGVPRVVARVYNPDKRVTYQALGLDHVVGTELLARYLMEMLLKPLVRRRGRCCQDRLNLVEFDCPPEWVGHTMEWCERKAPLWIAYLVREGKSLLPQPDTVLARGDEVTALAAEGAVQKLERYLRSRGRG
ncbi:MAG: hypothetical protein HPY75_09620 [Actinobacteria bacterium]|nr:hypothetical protein [Actinomycetota bacterium]